MNLTERAEIRKETFYKLTNSRDVPQVPSGNRNLYVLSKNSSILGTYIDSLTQNITTGEISFKVNGQDPFFGSQANKNEAFGNRGVKIPVKKGQDIAVQLTNELFIKNYVSYFGDDDISVKIYKPYLMDKFVVPASELEGVSYVSFRFGINENTQEIGSVHSTKVKVEYGNAHTVWSPAPEDLGWSTDTLVPTQQQRYLWKFEYIYYSDGSVEVTQPVNLSIAGGDGIAGKDGVGHLNTWNFYKLSNSTTAPQVVPIGSSTNLGHLGPNNAWTPFKELSGGPEGWNVIDFDKIAKSNIIPDKPFTWYLEASFDGVSNFNGSTDFNIKFENWYVNSAGSNVFDPLGTRDLQAKNFSATNDTAVRNYFSQFITWTVPRAVYDDIPEGGYLNLRIRIDRFTKLFYHAKNSYVTYGTVPSDPVKRGLGNYSTYGWKASPEAVTQALPYLWIYQIQFYDNSKEVAIPPMLIGTQGLDGRTPYIHFAYADDNKGTNFSLTDKNQQYQGYYSDYTEADSTDYKKYKWVDRLANIKGGSRNYFKNSLTKTFYTTDAQTFDWRTYIVDAFWKNKDRLKKNFVKISFDITFPVALENDYTANIHFSATPWYSNRVTFKAGTTSRQHFEFGIDLSSASEDYYTNNVFIRFGTNYGFPSDFKIILENMMLSIGSYYPDYIQAIEDTQDNIDSKADNALTQEQLNALEAKRLQMETEMKALATLQQVSKLETFINNLKQEDTDGRQKIIETTKAIEQHVKDIEPIMQYSKKLQFMDTYITQGNGGMIIGKNDSSTKVIVTPDRISFQSGGSEVAYISQSMLHIDNGVFTMSLQLGHYITRAHPKNEYVNATYFVK